ncbi:MAG: flagellar hook assembly protein FlgD [Rhizomicrobium sp.]
MTTSIPSSTAGTASTTGNAMNQLSGNFDTFLQLLTTQLQNQDPLDPMDTSQFTQQLVEYSQVEQQIDTNSNLQTMIGQGQSQSAAYATGYLGKTVTVGGGQGSLSGGQANWTYNLAADSTSTTLTVTDANGNTVFTGPGKTGAGDNVFTWNGNDNNGNPLPAGSYTLSVNAQNNGTTVTSTVSSSGVVSEVDMTNGAPELLIGSVAVPLSKVTRVQN